MSIIYLAAPYSHKDKAVMQDRFEWVSAVCAELMKKGYVVFSPITYSHQLSIDHSLPCNWEFWKNIDETFLKVCDGMLVLTLDGWEESVGLKAEVELAIKKAIPIKGIDTNLRTFEIEHFF